MSYEIKPAKGDAFCGFCRSNNWKGDDHYVSTVGFRMVTHTSNERQAYSFTICDKCAKAVADDLLEGLK